MGQPREGPHHPVQQRQDGGVVVGVGVEVGVPGHQHRLVQPLGRPGAEHPDGSQPVDVDHIGIELADLLDGSLEMPAVGDPRGHVRHPHRRQPHLDAALPPQMRVRPLGLRCDDHDLVAGVEQVALQLLNGEHQTVAAGTGVVGELRNLQATW